MRWAARSIPRSGSSSCRHQQRLLTAVLSRAPKPGSGELITPVKVKTITVKAGNVQTAMLVPLVSHAPQATILNHRRPPKLRQARTRSHRRPVPARHAPGVLLPVEPPARIDRLSDGFRAFRAGATPASIASCPFNRAIHAAPG